MQEDTSFCPSFSSYSSDKLADIAVKVSQELQSKLELDDDDFEFVSVTTNPDASSSSSSSDVFPIFNRDLLLLDDDVASSTRFPLKNLFIEDSSSSSSSSSSSEDELERIEPGTYCVWAPKQQSGQSSPPNRCKKSKSTGSGSCSSSSKRWRFRDLLKRSHSDGGVKDSFLYLKNNNEKETKEKKKKKKKVATKKVVSAHEAFYVRNKELKEGDKRKSYLPYRKDLVGLFSFNLNGFGR